MTAGICTVPDCDKPLRSSGSDYCGMHYSRVRRHGHPDVTRPYGGPQVGMCPVEGCDQPKNFNGMCKLHATRVARHGDPLAVTHQRDRNLPRGPGHHQWAGDDITYGGMHIRVRKTRGPASEHTCTDCGAPAKQWSYDRTDPGERIAEEGPYSTDISHYVPRCVPCHKRHDLVALGKSRAEGVMYFSPDGSGFTAWLCEDGSLSFDGPEAGAA